MNLHKRKSNWERLRDRELSIEILNARHELMRSTRAFFERNHFIEVDMPLLTPYPTLDPNIRNIEAFLKMCGKKRTLYLHTSPELSMKKMLASGLDRIYFLGKVFRDDELTPMHNPEFTILEWYKTRSDYTDLKKDVQKYIQEAAHRLLSRTVIRYGSRTIDLAGNWETRTIDSLFREKAGISLEENRNAEEFRRAAENCGIHTAPDDEWETVFFRVFLDKIEPGLGLPSPVFVCDYPQSLGLMALNRKDNPYWTERVELYIGGIELANGYSELLDPKEQRIRFLRNQQQKEIREAVHYPIDEELLKALEWNIPQTAGMALGVDRLLMLLLNAASIEDILPFPMAFWMENE